MPATRTMLVAAAKDSSVAPALEFRDVSKVYTRSLFGGAGIKALDHLNLRIEPGVVLGLLGPNRAGKTTLIKLLLSLCRPTSGEILRLGRPVSDRSTLAQVGYVHENHAFPRYLTAAGVLEYYGALSLLPYATVRQRVPELLERVGLADRGHEPISRFSKGMLQRLGLAQALINEPTLLVLDEPTEGLDLAGRHLLHDAVAEVWARKGTVVFVSHVLSEVEQICERVAVINRGRVIWQGSLDELRRSRVHGGSRTLEEALTDLYAERMP